MKKLTRLKYGPVALLALLALLVLHRKGRTAEEARGRTAEEAVRALVKVEDTVRHDKLVAVAFVGLLALFAFVTWTALCANDGADKAMPPARGRPNSRRPLRAEDEVLRWMAADCLGDIGPRAAAAVPALQSALQIHFEIAHVRTGLSIALDRIQGKAVDAGPH
jgi:hypothetical protein